MEKESERRPCAQDRAVWSVLTDFSCTKLMCSVFSTIKDMSDLKAIANTLRTIQCALRLLCDVSPSQFSQSSLQSKNHEFYHALVSIRI